ncbi:MAG: hypothetical protein H6977_13055 [Gammaproteobacteria bacterium]|nr:hypothetical protein [Gammaproteobacteria bacterium]
MRHAADGLPISRAPAGRGRALARTGTAHGLRNGLCYGLRLYNLVLAVISSLPSMPWYLGGPASTTTPLRPDGALLAAWNAGVARGNLQDNGRRYLHGVIGAARIADVALGPDPFPGARRAVLEPASLAQAALILAGVAPRRRTAI